MSYKLEDLVINRVDLVEEGANSEAFIELYKRKESNKPMTYSEILEQLKPEHSSVIEAEVNELKKSLEDANAALALLKEKECTCDGEADEDGMCKACGGRKKTEKAAPTEDEILKSMPEAAQELYKRAIAQKEAAEEEVRKAAEEKITAEAVAKAASFKSIPVSQDVLVKVIKSADEDVLSILEAANAAINATVLSDEVGKGTGNGAKVDGGDPWAAIEKAAKEIAERDSVTPQKAIAKAIQEHPDLYKEYLNGGAK